MRLLSGETQHRLEDRELGLGDRVTRRDFLNASLLGAGAALLHAAPPARGQELAPAPDWYGYGGVGEFAASHGNTPEVVRVAHQVRSGAFDRPPRDFKDTGEVFDLVVVGGGFAGLAAAHHFLKNRREGMTCLLLENHPMFGGEAKPNEFEVGGRRLVGPQGSNGFVLPAASFGDGAGLDPHRVESIKALARVFEELRVPTDFEHQAWDPERKPLRFANENYGFLLWSDADVSVGHFFDAPGGAEPRWLVDIWAARLDGTPFSAAVKQDLLRWRASDAKPYAGADFARWLDGMSYKQFLEEKLGLSPEVTAYADPILASALGLGCDALSAYSTLSILMPGVKAYAGATARYPRLLSFPGGNDGFTRYYVKALVPEALPGGHSLAKVLGRPVTQAALDRSGAPVRIRLGATVVRVEHEGSPERAERVSVMYVRDGKTCRVRARGIVMATGSWINRYVLRDLPLAPREACAELHHSPMLVANVALTNWRFLHALGITACRYQGEFGFACNIRQSLVYDGYRPPLDPDQPTVLTFYVPFFYPGQPIRAQGAQGRLELLTTSYAEYERQIRRQLVRVFGAAGFDPRRDIAGIILNRWGHAYVNPQPGFYFGSEGKTAARDVLRQPFGRIAIGHSELEGHQNWPGAVRNGARAASQVMSAY
jgi:spermidine dehydrogenase